jgi:hypothetical protein
LLPLNTAKVGVDLWFAKSWTTWNGIFIKARAGIPDTDSLGWTDGEFSSRGGCSPVRNVKSEAGQLRGDPQGIQAGELPATAHFCLLAEARSLHADGFVGTMAHISQNSRSLTTERGAIASFWKRSARPGAGILCASRMSGAEETDLAEDSPILSIH